MPIAKDNHVWDKCLEKFNELPLPEFVALLRSRVAVSALDSYRVEAVKVNGNLVVKIVLTELSKDKIVDTDNGNEFTVKVA